MISNALARAAADVWNNNSSVPLDRHRCSFALLPRTPSEPSARFAFVSLATQLEEFGAESFEVCDLEPASRTASATGIDRSAMYSRVLEGHVGVVFAPAEAPGAGPHALPDAVVDARDRLRLRDVTARQAIQQIGLDQLTGPRGAHADLFDLVAALWDTDLSIQIDVATTLTAGADRQRYLDPSYHSQLRIGRRAALRQLANRSVQSNPLLTI